MYFMYMYFKSIRSTAKQFKSQNLIKNKAPHPNPLPSIDPEGFVHAGCFASSNNHRRAYPNKKKTTKHNECHGGGWGRGITR